MSGGLDISWYVSCLFYYSSTHNPERTETGTTIDGGEEFTTFLGPMFAELQDKYRQWLQLTYSMLYFLVYSIAQTLTLFHSE